MTTVKHYKGPVRADGTPIEVQNAFVRLATGLDDLYILDRTIDLEDGGSYTLYYEFDGVAEGPLDVRFQCVTWGWDEAIGSFCSDDRSESIDLFCTLNPPEAP
jgi:hypothetical protein